MGSSRPSEGADPQHELLQHPPSPVCTRRAAPAYFSRTTSFRSTTSPPDPSIGPSEPACPSRRSPWGSPPGFGCSTRHRETPGDRGASRCPPHTRDRCPLCGLSPILRASIFPGGGRGWSEESPARTGCLRPPSPRDAPTAAAARSADGALSPAPRTYRRTGPRRPRPAASPLRRSSPWLAPVPSSYFDNIGNMGECQGGVPTLGIIRPEVLLERPEGFEPPTRCFEGSCSIP